MVKLEIAENLPDPEVDALYVAAEDKIGIDELLSGWAMVAALLRKQLIRNASVCGCGPAKWLNFEQLRLAARWASGQRATKRRSPQLSMRCLSTA